MTAMRAHAIGGGVVTECCDIGRSAYHVVAGGMGKKRGMKRKRPVNCSTATATSRQEADMLALRVSAISYCEVRRPAGCGVDEATEMSNSGVRDLSTVPRSSHD